MISKRDLYSLLALVLFLVGPVGPAASADVAAIRAAAKAKATALKAAAADAAAEARSNAVAAAAAARAAARAGRNGGGGSTPPPTPTPDTTPPSSPKNLTAVATSCSEVRISWSRSTDTGGSGLEGYDVWRNGQYRMRVVAPFTAASDGGLIESSGYSYQVAAFDGANNRSTISSFATATTAACDVPDAPGPGPQIVGSVAVAGEIYDVAADDLRRLAVVSSPDARRLTVVGFDAPEEPAILGTLILENMPTGVALGGVHAYVVEVVPGAIVSTNLVVVDLSNPAKPTLKARLPISGSWGGGEGVAVDGAFAYVAATSSGLQVVDVSSPAAPRIIGSAPQIIGSGGRLEAAASLALGDGVAFVLGRFGELQVLDTSDPRRPIEIGSYGLSAEAIAIAGDTLALTWGNVYDAWDVSDPHSPSVEARGNVQKTRDVAITSGGIAVGTESGVSLFDPSRVVGGEFELLGDVTTPAELLSLVFSGNLILAGDSGGTLSVISID